jgi:hypothetical protein
VWLERHAPTKKGTAARSSAITSRAIAEHIVCELLIDFAIIRDHHNK